MTHRNDQHRISQRGRRGIWASSNGHKAVKVEYADAALPDWLSKAEYERNKTGFRPGDRIWIDGHEITVQPALFEMEV
jgi:hypothetical protein